MSDDERLDAEAAAYDSLETIGGGGGDGSAAGVSTRPSSVRPSGHQPSLPSIAYILNAGIAASLDVISLLLIRCELFDGVIIGFGDAIPASGLPTALSDAPRERWVCAFFVLLYCCCGRGGGGFNVYDLSSTNIFVFSCFVATFATPLALHKFLQWCLDLRRDRGHGEREHRTTFRR